MQNGAACYYCVKHPLPLTHHPPLLIPVDGSILSAPLRPARQSARSPISQRHDIPDYHCWTTTAISSLASPSKGVRHVLCVCGNVLDSWLNSAAPLFNLFRCPSLPFSSPLYVLTSFIPVPGLPWLLQLVTFVATATVIRFQHDLPGQSHTSDKPRHLYLPWL